MTHVKPLKPFCTAPFRHHRDSVQPVWLPARSSPVPRRPTAVQGTAEAHRGAAHGLLSRQARPARHPYT